MILKHRFLPQVIYAALLICVGCGGHDFWTTTNPPSPTNPTGATPKFAYAANFTGGSAGSVSAYTITSSGALTAVANSPFAAGTGTIAVGADSAGKFLYAANQGGGVSAFSINRTDGTLTAIGGSPFATGTTPAWVAVDPGGRFVYVVNAGSNDISGYTANTSTGALSAFNSTTPLGGTPVRATVDPGGRFLYVALGATGTGIYKINSDATLTLVRTLTPAPCAASDDIALDPNSRFLFMADGANAICNYAVNASTGDLTLISSASISAGTNPVGIAVGSAGKFLFAANKGSNNISGYTINADGTLTAMTGSPFSVGTGAVPVAVNVDPSGSFVYVANFSGNTISIFTINSSTLSSATTVTTGTNPNSVVTTP